MRVAVLSPELKFSLEERDRPMPQAEEVLVRMRSIGICGSDVHYYEHGRIGDYVVNDPLILGHESAGDVVAVGENVDEARVGERVTLEPGVPCRRCEHCARGEYNLCPDVTFMATPPDDGAFAEYVSWPADFAYALPENVSLDEGALVEPLSVGVHVARRADIDVGDSVFISGSGPIGLVVMEAVRAAGATDVIISDVVSEKLALAEQRGADAVVNVSEDDLQSAVEEATDGRGVDVAVEASGAPVAVQSAFETVRRGGAVVLVGLAPDGEVPLDTNEIIDNELDVFGSFRYRNTYPAAIDLLADGAVDVEGIIDFDSALDDIDAAFQRAQQPETVKGMIRLGGE